MSASRITDLFYRNTGEIQGSLSKLEPFFFIAKLGAFGKMARWRIRNESKGRFLIGFRAGKGCAFKTGIILPVSCCHNPETREVLLSLNDTLVSEHRYYTAKSMRTKAQKILEKLLPHKLSISPTAGLDGSIEFSADRNLFALLTEQFSYLESVRDDPKGLVEPLEQTPFQWPSYGQFMEWFYEGIESDMWGWARCAPYLVFEKTCLLGSIGLGISEVERPSLDLSRYFKIAEDVRTDRISVLFEMGKFGWANIHLSLGEKSAKIWLSEVFPPFDALLAWLKMLDRDDIPALFHIDEEGQEKTFSVFATNEYARVLFRLTDRYTDEVLLQGIVDRHQFLGEFKRAFLHFFREDFNPEHWRESESEEEPTSCLQVRMLHDRWLMWQKKE